MTSVGTTGSRQLLRAEGLSKRFGGVQALSDVSFAMHRGQIVGLIGPNGSGKSTCVNLLSGNLPVSAGEVWLDDELLTGEPIDAAVVKGLARTFQSTQIFAEHTALENVMLGCHTLFKQGPEKSVLRTASAKRENLELVTHAERSLALVGLAPRRDQIASTLSAAEQRLLMIAVALATKPKVILLDEPAAGMVASERRALAGIIRALPSHGVSVLVIEHHMGLIMEVCDRIVVLNFGQKIAEGTPAEIRNNQAVIDAYLGHRDHA
ncbi:amino acid/amide ABC transporter ATP-binding protein 1, HAAT family [Bradyrhizobium erythrophlei]|nr:amino acid/amide ABC transporter ATP-binding protein 1, HAAT family [Bradyrhizobium erythrophlei]